MNTKMIGGVVIVFIMIMVAIMMFPMLMDSFDDMQVDSATATANSTTGVGETTDTIALADPLYEDDVANVTSVNSDNGSDTPTASSYAAATDTLTVAGLAASGTRVLTIAYNSEALDGYTGLKDMVRLAGFILFAGLIIAALAGVYRSAQGRG